MMHPLPPYARRVEYLEVGLSGTFSVITDFTADTGYIEAKLEAYSTDSFNPNGARWQYGFRKSGTANDDAHRLLLYTSTTYTGSGKRWDLGRGVSSPDQRILASFPGVLNITKRWFNTSGREVPDKFRLFGSTADPPDAIPLRLYYFRFYDPTGSTIAAEFIPCRILDRGYVFDTVSGKFYGNSGTGDFVLGPDVREGVVPTRLNPFGVGRRQEEIRRVEYLESTGTQWIDTGVVPFNGMVLSGDFLMNRNAFSVNNVFFGRSMTGSLNKYGFSLFVGGNSKTAAVIINNVRTNFTNQIPDGQRVRIFVDTGSGVCSVGDETITAQSLSGSYLSSLFLLSYSSDTTNYIGKTFGFSIRDSSGTLVRDFVPVAIGSVGYLLDRASGRLFGNQGTGDFVVGPDIVPVEYVESTGEQYVDTGVVGGGNSGVEIVASSPNDSELAALFGARESVSVRGFTIFQRTHILSNYGVRYDYYDNSTAGSRMVLASSAWSTTATNTVEKYGIENYLNGIRSADSPASSFSCDRAFYLGAINNAGSPLLPFVGRIYSCSIYDGSTLLRDFIPVRVGSVGALYDKVTDTVFRSATSTPLVAGPDTRHPAG